MTATYVEKIWTAKDIDHISSLEVALDKHAKMVKARDATIAQLKAEAAKRAGA